MVDLVTRIQVFMAARDRNADMESFAPDASDVLIVDDSEEMRETLERLLRRHHFATRCADDGEVALSCILERPPAAMIVDCRMDRVDGICLLARMRELGIRVPVIVLTAYPAVPDAVRAIKLGASEYLTKPFDHEQLLRMLTRLISNPTATELPHGTHDGLAPLSALFRQMGPSRHIHDLIAAVARVAKTDFSVLVVGETGTGKELVARAIHHASSRAAGPFVAVDCGAISESLFENELFGHEKGAFTGATDKAAGRFEAANHGTLFLDEVANLPCPAQPKLLRALEQRAVWRLGSSRALPVDVRIVAATNIGPESLLESGRFRPDLFYRLNEFVLRVPPLRERSEDIPYLSKRFLAAANAELNKNIQGFSNQALELLSNHGWPGNVRELLHVIRQAALSADETLGARDLGISNSGPARPPERLQWKGMPLREVVRQHLIAVERRILTEALRTAAGNKAQAARMLKIDYKTIHQKLKEYGIHPKGGD